ncbi:MAG TPA: response regulator transcription factor [Anaerolineae bacterium]|nr:response regulator transcription factor [Anaerolineae bacterium]
MAAETMAQAIPHRILIVDDVPSVREALRWLLDNEPDLEVVGEAGDGAQALERATLLAPDVVILDIELPDLDGYAVTRSLKRLPRPPLVILLSVHGDGLSRQQGADAGSDGFIEKGTDWPQIVAQIRQALASQRRI